MQNVSLTLVRLASAFALFGIGFAGLVKFGNVQMGVTPFAAFSCFIAPALFMFGLSTVFRRIG